MLEHYFHTNLCTNLARYVLFVKHLHEKNSMDYTGIEQHVYDKISTKVIQMIIQMDDQ
jgi:hypothetical protein